MVADRAPDNIREMEGVFNQIVAKARFAPGEMTIERAERTIDRFEQPRNHFNRVTIRSVLEETAVEYRLEVSDLVSKRRTKRVNAARQVGMFIARDLTEASLPQIGDAFGGRTHSTVLHSCNKVTEELEFDLNLQAHIDAIRGRLLGD